MVFKTVRVEEDTTQAVHLSLSDHKVVIHVLAIAAFIYGISIGLNFSSFGLYLYQHNFSHELIGIILSMELVGNVLTGPFMPRIIAKIGFWRVVYLGAIGRSCALMIFAVSSSAIHFGLALLLLGFSGFLLFAAVQQWANSASSDKFRGINIAKINISILLGMAFGPIIISIFHDEISGVIFGVNCVVSLIVPLILSLIKNYQPIHTETIDSSASSWDLIKMNRVAIASSFTAEYLLYSVSNFVVLFALANGIPKFNAILINTYTLCASVLWNIPLGVMVDKVSKFIILMITSFVLLSAGLTLHFMHSTITVIANFVVISMCITSIYITAIALLGMKMRGKKLAAANALMVAVNSLGGLIGLYLTGHLMDRFGNLGFVISITGVVSVHFIFMLIQFVQKEKDHLE